MAKKIDGMMLKEMFSSGAALLTQNRESVDALNVFPVPDGDTGTNMTQTITSAIREMNSKRYTSVSDVADAVARGALKGARGNSGVILSQILRGFARALAGHDEIDVPLLAQMMREGANTAYKAIMKPKEGTILTVARVIADETEKIAPQCEDVDALFKAILVSGDAILRRTPDMLPVLKQAGVVDSGGMGLMVVYRGMYSALTGEPVEQTEMDGKAEKTHARRVRGRSRGAVGGGHQVRLLHRIHRLPSPPGHEGQRGRALPQASGAHRRLRGGRLRPVHGQGARTHQRPRQGHCSTRWSWASWMPSRWTTCSRRRGSAPR